MGRRPLQPHPTALEDHNHGPCVMDWCVAVEAAYSQGRSPMSDQAAISATPLPHSRAHFTWLPRGGWVCVASSGGLVRAQGDGGCGWRWSYVVVHVPFGAGAGVYVKLLG